jgi:hypothetical protein
VANIIGNWEGGYVVEDSKGKRTYYIRRRVGGTRYDVSTRLPHAEGRMVSLFGTKMVEPSLNFGQRPQRIGDDFRTRSSGAALGAKRAM